MKGQLKVATPAEYLARLKEPRKSELAALDALIRKTAPNLEPFIYSGMLGYGPWHYKYASGREGDGCRIGVASNANYISLYICAQDDKGYVPERYKKALSKAKIGKSCVRFKNLADLDKEILSRLIREGAGAHAKA
ncbi:MAG TPA: DUF1801 domain-containing protein [Candidatus Acidoferrales bacterium]|nr:DUF1801 domain-containing protein [Candidatus Acidoferrales bacterium]